MGKNIPLRIAGLHARREGGAGLGDFVQQSGRACGWNRLCAWAPFESRAMPDFQPNQVATLAKPIAVIRWCVTSAPTRPLEPTEPVFRL